MRRLVSLSIVALAAAASGAFAVGFRAAEAKPLDSGTGRASGVALELAPGRAWWRRDAGRDLAAARRRSRPVRRRRNPARPRRAAGGARRGCRRRAVAHRRGGRRHRRSALPVGPRVRRRRAGSALVRPAGARLRTSLAHRGVAVPIEYGPRALCRPLLLVELDRHGVPHLAGSPRRVRAVPTEQSAVAARAPAARPRRRAGPDPELRAGSCASPLRARPGASRRPSRPHRWGSARHFAGRRGHI
jgi:hypothetical protein